jgi:hypothetical protein
MQGNEIQVLPQNELSTGMLLWADQVLTATNAKRLTLNAQIRALLGRGPEPEDELIAAGNCSKLNRMSPAAFGPQGHSNRRISRDSVF